MRIFLDDDCDDGMLDTPIIFVHSGNEFEIEVEALDGLVNLVE